MSPELAKPLGKAVSVRRVAWLLLAVATIIAPGGATASSRLDDTAFRVKLGCQISQVKVIVITNTASPIAAGTQITYDAIRLGDGQHYGRTGGGPFLAPGTSFKVGGAPSSSCTAWYRRQLLLAP